MTDFEIPARVTPADLTPEIRPPDDLYGHVNARWIDATPIPADQSRWGVFMMLRDLSEERVREIVTGAVSAPAGSEERRFGDLYTSFMDEAGVAARGVAPLEEYFAAIAAMSDRGELLATLAHLQRRGAGALFELFVAADPGNPERNVAMFEQGGLSLPDESYYREAHFAPVRDAFVEHVARMFVLTGFDDAPARARRVMDVEAAFAAQHWDNVRSRDRDLTYNVMGWDQLAALWSSEAPTTPIAAWRTAFLAPPGALDEVLVRQPSFISGAARVCEEMDLAALADWLRYRVVAAYAPYLSDEVSAANFDFYGRTLTGAPQQRARWKRGVALVEGVMGQAVGRVYVRRYFPPSAKEKMDELVGWLVAAYRESISELEWMSAPTRERALEKLAQFTPKIGYPTKWREYDGLVIDPADLIGNLARANDFEWARQLAKIAGPVEREEWLTTPQTVNAFYYSTFNDITFPAAILQAPFFDEGRDAAENFGAIGAVIGHEIGHGFDDQGSKSDGSGRLRDWWESADRAAFAERTARLIAQYDALSPRQTPGQHVNGALTVGENIGDLGGAGIAWRAYQLSLGGAEAPVIDGLTGAQRFFFAWALVWRSKARDEEVARLLAIDPHSPNEFRCNQIVRNLDAFYEAFGVEPGDALWLDPAERVTIW